MKTVPFDSQGEKENIYQRELSRYVAEPRVTTPRTPHQVRMLSSKQWQAVVKTWKLMLVNRAASQGDARPFKELPNWINSCWIHPLGKSTFSLLAEFSQKGKCLYSLPQEFPISHFLWTAQASIQQTLIEWQLCWAQCKCWEPKDNFRVVGPT